jgi:hypothetical protein
MAQRATNGIDERRQGRIEALAAAAPGQWTELDGPFNIVLSGMWTGLVALECSFDGGTTAVPCMLADGQPVTFGGNGQHVASEAVEAGILYRLVRGAGTGTLNYRLSR